ncbi:CPBP family intramembrane metalloprotease [Muricauda sp. HICW]|uniref:CPBP family intramembrane metalloprotease n=1 Tax=Flagellimonas chongwuensis TaxID=2697365 RepID=A0A850NLJ1_9FLAO|nr:CPBP family intramembrane glutamic endopeptidase [Allomuricauda chongwuensis]NVN18157.1 CPBP family intramembrane metalloprotease [Allomuricauda chongwuensis]
MEENDIKGWQRVLLLVLPYLFFVGIFQFVGMVVSGQETSVAEVGIQEETTLQRIIVAAFGLMGFLLLISLFMKYVDKKSFLDLGLYFKNNGKDILFGVLAGLLIMGMGYGLLILFGQLEFKEMNFIGIEFLLTLVLYTIVSFSEEILLRGYILRNFMESMNNFLALLLSAILFSIMHSANPNISWIGFVNLFLAGIIMGLPYIYTQSLWFPIAFHFSWNFFQSLFGFNVSGMNSYSLIEFSFSERNIINGGDFGFEGSLLSILLQISLIFTLYFTYRQSKQKNNLTKIVN